MKINSSIADPGSKNLGGWREEGRNLVSLERHPAHISSTAVSFYMRSGKTRPLERGGMKAAGCA